MASKCVEDSGVDASNEDSGDDSEHSCAFRNRMIIPEEMQALIDKLNPKLDFVDIAILLADIRQESMKSNEDPQSRTFQNLKFIENHLSELEERHDMRDITKCDAYHQILKALQDMAKERDLQMKKAFRASLAMRKADESAWVETHRMVDSHLANMPKIEVRNPLIPGKPARQSPEQIWVEKEEVALIKTMCGDISNIPDCMERPWNTHDYLNYLLSSGILASSPEVEDLLKECESHEDLQIDWIVNNFPEEDFHLGHLSLDRAFVTRSVQRYQKLLRIRLRHAEEELAAAEVMEQMLMTSLGKAYYLYRGTRSFNSMMTKTCCESGFAFGLGNRVECRLSTLHLSLFSIVFDHYLDLLTPCPVPADYPIIFNINDKEINEMWERVKKASKVVTSQATLSEPITRMNPIQCFSGSFVSCSCSTVRGFVEIGENNLNPETWPGLTGDESDGKDFLGPLGTDDNVPNDSFLEKVAPRKLLSPKERKMLMTAKEVGYRGYVASAKFSNYDTLTPEGMNRILKFFPNLMMPLYEAIKKPPESRYRRKKFEPLVVSMPHTMATLYIRGERLCPAAYAAFLYIAWLFDEYDTVSSVLEKSLVTILRHTCPSDVWENKIHVELMDNNMGESFDPTVEIRALDPQNFDRYRLDDIYWPFSGGLDEQNLPLPNDMNEIFEQGAANLSNKARKSKNPLQLMNPMSHPRRNPHLPDKTFPFADLRKASFVQGCEWLEYGCFQVFGHGSEIGDEKAVGEIRMGNSFGLIPVEEPVLMRMDTEVRPPAKGSNKLTVTTTVTTTAINKKKPGACSNRKRK